MKFMLPIFLFFTLTQASIAGVGKILKVSGDTSAYVLRKNEKLKMTEGLSVLSGDQIFSEGSVVLVHLFPSTQIGFAKRSIVKVDQHRVHESKDRDQSDSVINYVQGTIRLKSFREPQVDLKQMVQADGVAFTVRGTDFEVTTNRTDIDLDVHEGEVEVTSPYVMTFVPEIIKAGQGFRFDKNKRKFITRKFGPRSTHPAKFLSREKLRDLWLSEKKLRQEARAKRRKLKKEPKKF